ncbi:MAG: hypothetical protein HY074_09665 [Deltaproteobacteria bacterium]|nr:hypothetical protein [Deltaproteobacteria bacterium]
MSEQDPEANTKVNALYTIFEKHLYDFEDNEESEHAFVDKIVHDYLRHLVAKNIAVPRRWHAHIVEELRDQVRKMMVKKMYGCLSIEEFVMGQTDRPARRKASKKKYSKLY